MASSTSSGASSAGRKISTMSTVPESEDKSGNTVSPQIFCPAAPGLTGITLNPFLSKYFMTKLLGRFQVALAPTIAMLRTFFSISRI